MGKFGAAPADVRREERLAPETNSAELNPMSGVEVRYERLRPSEIVSAREAHPVVYIPLGTLEWHGHHDPVGLDGLKAQALAIRCAEAGGGLVFPTLWFGENRDGHLLEMFPEFQDAVIRDMKLDPAAFAPGYMGRTIPAQVQGYQALLLHILAEAASYGFKVIAFVAGHYPLLKQAEAANGLFYYQCCRYLNLPDIPVTWAFSDYELVTDLYPGIQDHAGFWETSLLMALDPGLIDLDTLPKDESELIGVLGTSRPVREANAEFGEEAVGAIVGRVVDQVRQRLADPEKFYSR